MKGSVSQINQQLVNINNQLAAITAWQSGIWNPQINVRDFLFEGATGRIVVNYTPKLNLLNMYGFIYNQSGEEQPVNTPIFNLGLFPKENRSISYCGYIGTSTNVETPFSMTVNTNGNVSINTALPQLKSAIVQITLCVNGWF